jgi:hypothetical protein
MSHAMQADARDQTPTSVDYFATPVQTVSLCLTSPAQAAKNKRNNLVTET